MTRRTTTAAIVFAAAAGAAAPALAQIQGPSSSATPYLLPASGYKSISLLTVGDSVNTKPGSSDPYRLVGLPDGLGAYDNNDGTFTVLMTHEVQATAGVARAHGATGAFVSQWTVNKSNFAVLHGADLVQNVATWNTLANAYNAPTTGIQMGRLCSADLPAPLAFFHDPTPLLPNSGDELGTTARIFTGGEEVGSEGRAFGHIATGAAAGTSYELPRLGKFSWENAVANPAAGAKTLVMGTDDSTPGEVYLYVGDKQASGTDVDKAGLTNGNLFGIQVSDLPGTNSTESRNNAFGSSAFDGTSRFTLHNHGNVSNQTGATLDANDEANGVTDFLRPEDGAWDPNSPNDFYFVTTDRFDPNKAVNDASDGRSRLYRMRFDDIANPNAGGEITSVLADTHAGQMFDNMTVTDDGLVIMQEDAGNQSHLGKIWVHDIDGPANNLTQLATHDGARFLTGMPGFLTQDEESSGVIDISYMFGGVPTYLVDVQAHYAISGELVEGGQLVVIQVPEPASFGALGIAGLLALSRRVRRRRGA